MISISVVPNNLSSSLAALKQADFLLNDANFVFTISFG